MLPKMMNHEHTHKWDIPKLWSPSHQFNGSSIIAFILAFQLQRSLNEMISTGNVMSGEDVADIWNGCTFLPRLSKEPVLRWVEIQFGQFSDHDFFILVFILLCYKVLIIDFFKKLIEFLAEIDTG